MYFRRASAYPFNDMIDSNDIYSARSDESIVFIYFLKTNEYTSSPSHTYIYDRENMKITSNRCRHTTVVDDILMIFIIKSQIFLMKVSTSSMKFFANRTFQN
jgi:hypothetical protein